MHATTNINNYYTWHNSSAGMQSVRDGSGILLNPLLRRACRSRATKGSSCYRLSFSLAGERKIKRTARPAGASHFFLFYYSLDLYAVQTLQPGLARTSGDHFFLGEAGDEHNGTGTGLPNGIYYDMKKSTVSENAYAVGHDNTTGRLVAFEDGEWRNPQTSTGDKYKALHTLEENEHFMVVGDNSLVQYFNYTGTLNTFEALEDDKIALPTEIANNSEDYHFRDVTFTDNISGYIVGESGMLLKSPASRYETDTDINYEYTEFIFDYLPTEDELNGQTDSTLMQINTIAFNGPYHGFMGGRYDNNLPVENYARRIKDMTFKFSTLFWYDRLGRLVVSQNTKQFNREEKSYSYTLYDALGRVTEAGEKDENPEEEIQFSEIFGAEVAGYFNPNVINDEKLNEWVSGSGTRREVTRTVYDNPEALIAGELPEDFEQDHLRKRITHVVFQKEYDENINNFNYASHYTYDIHGNVKSLIQDHKDLEEDEETADHRFKRIDYTYDLISGNVHEVAYQKGELDAWYHRYEYDADNRITHVHTSKDYIQWDKDARYFYYDHGPLARVELGDNQVQGMDYAYTLQGWIKGVNSDILDPENDMGLDSHNDENNPNRYFAKDAMGFSLGYFEGDYTAIDAMGRWADPEKRFLAETNNSNLLATRNDLYNGNIGSMVTTITDPETREVLPQGTAYKYDQLNRLLEARAWQDIDMEYNFWEVGDGSTYDNKYFNKFVYDANGNILNQTRYDHTGTPIDDMTYRYLRNTAGELLQNRLYHVNDEHDYGDDDIHDMGVFITEDENGEFSAEQVKTENNYRYTALGELEFDEQEEIEEIKWRVDGKIKEIKRFNNSQKLNLKFDYDPMGNRIAKHIYAPQGNNPWQRSTYYVRDAQGNVLSVYEKKMEVNTGQGQGQGNGNPGGGNGPGGNGPPGNPGELTFVQSERHIYGSSRLGMDVTPLELISPLENDEDASERILRYKQYELTNHLDNLISMVSDVKIPVDEMEDGEVDFWVSDVMVAQDYSPYGALLYDRKFNSGESKHGFNGQRKTTEIHPDHHTAEFWEYDPRAVHRWNRDPKWHPSFSPYSILQGSPILHADPLGDTTYVYNLSGGYVTTLFDNLNTNEVVFLTDEQAQTLHGLTSGGRANHTMMAEIARDPNIATARFTQNTANQLKQYHQEAGSGGNFMEPGGVLWIDSETKELQATSVPEASVSGSRFRPLNMFKAGWSSKFLAEEEVGGEIFAFWHGHPGKGLVASDPTDPADLLRNENIGMNPLFSKFFGDNKAIGLIVTEEVTTIFPYGGGNEFLRQFPFRSSKSKLIDGSRENNTQYGSFRHGGVGLKTDWDE